MESVFIVPHFSITNRYASLVDGLFGDQPNKESIPVYFTGQISVPQGTACEAIDTAFSKQREKHLLPSFGSGVAQSFDSRGWEGLIDYAELEQQEYKYAKFRDNVKRIPFCGHSTSVLASTEKSRVLMLRAMPKINPNCSNLATLRLFHLSSIFSSLLHSKNPKIDYSNPVISKVYAAYHEQYRLSLALFEQKLVEAVQDGVQNLTIIADNFVFGKMVVEHEFPVGDCFYAPYNAGIYLDYLTSLQSALLSRKSGTSLLLIDSVAHCSEQVFCAMEGKYSKSGCTGYALAGASNKSDGDPHPIILNIE